MDDFTKKTNVPRLYLAPMEGLGSYPFRQAIQTIGGFDEACTEFIRMPINAHPESLIKRYDPHELGNTPIAAQLMGSNPETMAKACFLLEQKGAPRVDLNCGCPSNTVTGRGAGSSLLKTPNLLFDVTKAMKQSVSIPVSVKLRSGFEDTSLLKENLLAAQEAGADFITLHPRTKIEGYKPPAHWNLIAFAKDLLSIPVVGNGDIVTLSDALEMLKQTHCDALMIGRGAVQNPWIFSEIKSYFQTPNQEETYESFKLFLETFIQSLSDKARLKNNLNHLKQLGSFLFERTPFLKEQKRTFLRSQFTSTHEMKLSILNIMKNSHFEKSLTKV